MKVILKRLFFADGNRYRPGVDSKPTEVPDHLRGKLPRDAEVVENPAPAIAVPAHDTLRDFDEVRMASKVEDVAMEKLRKDLEGAGGKKK